MHKTNAGEKRKTLKMQADALARDAKAARNAAKILPEAQIEAQRLQEEADKVKAEIEVTKRIMRLEDLTVWKMDKAKETKKGMKSYTYWMASWREGKKVRNIHLGSIAKMDAEAALQKARKMKAEALGLRS